MVSFKALFGSIPSTAETEAKRAALLREYEAFLEFSKSKELSEFLELENEVTSAEFAQRKKEIMAQKFKDTEEFRKEQEYLNRKKEKDIKNYYRVKESNELKDLQAFEQSEDLKKYHELEEYIKSPEFNEVKNYMALSPKRKFESSELYKTLGQYLEQKKSPKIKNYFKFINSKEYTDFKNLYKSKRLKDFEELRDFIKSGEFLSARRSKKKSDFKFTEEYQKLQQYEGLKKSKEFKNYFKLAKSPKLIDYNELHDSQELEAYIELEKYINSAEYKSEKNRIESQKFEDTDEYKKLQEYNTLKNSKRFKDNFRFKSSSLYANYLNLEGSERISQVEELEKVIQSDKFREVKEYMLLPPAKKLELSEEYKLEQKYIELKNSEKIVWYFELKDSTKFDELKSWKLTFEEDFSAGKLDRDKWMTRYYWGDALLKDSYSFAHEKHFFTDGENLEIDNGILKVLTRKEKASGKAWSPQVGFYTKDFDYTSGLISTGNSFRQKYGLFEAKIRFNKSAPVNHSFWMLSDQVLPHIDIAKAEDKLVMSSYWGDINERRGVRKKISKLGLSKFSQDFYIYSLEWSQDKLVWKINDVAVASSTGGVPQESMYLILSSGIYKDIKGNNLPASMEIDWVRCYKKV
jgi:beta-glucanase (GH16 family)